MPNKSGSTRISRKSRGKRGSWSDEAMRKAVTAVKRKEMGFNAATKAFGIPRATLKRYIDQSTLPTVCKKK